MISKILIIDDDPAVNSLFAQVVEHIGHRAHTAMTGQQGLSAIQNTQFDLVLLDIGLPDGDGCRLLSQIRFLNNPPEVIVVSGSSHQEVSETAVKNGARDWMVKPTSLVDLKSKIEGALAHRHNKNPLPLPTASISADDTENQPASSPLGKTDNKWLSLHAYRDQTHQRCLAS